MKKLAAILLILAFVSVNAFAQAQPQKKAEGKAKKEMKVEKKAEKKEKHEAKVEKKAEKKEKKAAKKEAAK